MEKQFSIVTDEVTLRQKSMPVNESSYIDHMFVETMQIINKMEKTLAETSGVGLAAIQIAIPLRICIVRYRYPKGHQHNADMLSLNMINPVIEEKEDIIIHPGEGCLSIPGMVFNPHRYRQVTANWLDANTGKRLRAVFTDMEAFILQHEIDHMDGILVKDRAYKTSEVGRNDPCPCGSGKKYKKCCLK